MVDASATAAVKVTYTAALWTFSFRPQNKVLRNGKVQIDFAGEVSIPDTALAQSTCASVSGYESGMTCVVSSNSITANDGFVTSPFEAGGVLSFSIEHVLNPVSTQPTSSFSFFTKTENNYGIDQKTSGITETMVSTGQMVSAAVAISSVVNGDVNNYVLTVSASSPLQNGNTLYIRAPDTVTAPLTPTCTGDGSVLKSSLTCTTTNKETYIDLQFEGKSPALKCVLI